MNSQMLDRSFSPQNLHTANIQCNHVPIWRISCRNLELNMVPKIANIMVSIDGMSCPACENRISSALSRIKGVDSVAVSYLKAQSLITFDANLVSEAYLHQVIESLGYKVSRPSSGPPILASTAQKTSSKGVHKPAQAPGVAVAAEPRQKPAIRKILGLGIILLALYVILRQLGGLNIFNVFPQAKEGMGLLLLFGIGLLTSIHCLAMCGGINLSQSIQTRNPGGKADSAAGRLKPAILYNAGRVVSYTLLGGAVGAAGSVLSFSGWAAGLVAVAAGIFMVIMGVNMLGLFPGLRRLSLRIPGKIGQKVGRARQNSGRPFFIGLLNGLMPCGPLQAMQLYALSTGSFWKGALSMFLFSLGTVPLMFGFGALSSKISQKFTKRLMQASAVLVVVLGILMLQNGLALSGAVLPDLGNLIGRSSPDTKQSSTQIGNPADGVQLITTQLSASSYEPITVKAGIPVRWTIHAAPGTVNSCNGRLVIPQYRLTKDLAEGDNVIEFTPEKAGRIPFSCWMGMIRSQITVVAAEGS
jgi:uncharacterized protein